MVFVGRGSGTFSFVFKADEYLYNNLNGVASQNTAI
jgi:hypothetical protein